MAQRNAVSEALVQELLNSPHFEVFLRERLQSDPQMQSLATLIHGANARVQF